VSVLAVPTAERTFYPAALVIIWVVLACVALRPGISYYVLPEPERAFSPLKEQFAPTGRIGHSFGILGTFMMFVGVSTYTLRKRWSALHRFGKLKYWLQTHIFLCTFGPFLILLHTTFKFGGIVSIAFWSMTLVVLSGVFGRYVYVRIPKAVNGQFRTLQDVRKQRDELTQAIKARTDVRLSGLEQIIPKGVATGSLGALFASMRLEIQARRRIAYARRRLTSAGVAQREVAGLTGLLEEQMRIERQLALLAPFHRLFRYWHVFHLPFAIVMFVILAVHIGVAVAFGYGWPF
jgi:hypothetical protein